MTPASPPDGREGIRNVTALLPCRSCADLARAGRTGSIAALIAQQASAMCSHVADTQTAASLRKMASRRDQGRGLPEMNARPNIVLVHGAWATAAVAVAATS